MENYNPNESIKESIRVMFYNENGRKLLTFDRADKKYETTIETCGYEDLSLKEDGNKLNLYQNSKYLSFCDNRVYEVVKREFTPCVPVCLYLYLKEV